MKLSKSDQIKFFENEVIHQSAGGFVFHEAIGGHILYVALLQKPDGKFYIPKGHILEGEEPDKAALREIKEELALEKSDLRIVTKMGINNYVFNLPDDKRTHYKNVHLYVFESSSKKEIKPLERENFVSAEWLEFHDALGKIAFDRENLLRARQLFNSNKIRQSVVKVLKNNLGDSLLAIISVGSVASENYKELWSDIDILIIVEKLDLQTKRKVAQSKEVLEENSGQHFGINIITKQEFQNPVLPTIALDGKTLQALLDLKLSPERLIFFKDKRLDTFYSPNKKEVKDYSLANLFMFPRRNRKTLTGQIPKTLKEYKEMVEREMRAGFTMAKLSIQYFTLYNCNNKEEIIKITQKLFPDFSFKSLETNLQSMDIWDQIKERQQLDSILESTDLFIEKFSRHILKIIGEGHKLSLD